MTVPQPHEPGIFFGLPEAEYHGAFALSNSGAKNLMVSTLDFWARSMLNPDREDETSEQMDLGKAYHTRILDGRDAFYAAYAPAVQIEDHPDALVSSDEIKAELKERGLKVSGKKDELIERLLEADPSVEIWDRIKEDHVRKHGGRSLLPPKTIQRIEISAAMIEKHPELSKCFRGGQPEVSIFWTDAITGTPMKARLDYLKPRAIVDLKTFSNPYGKPIGRAISTAMAGGRYHIQAACYFEAVEMAVEFIKHGMVHGEADKDFLKALAGANERQFVFVFQQTGIAPVARGMILPKNLTYECGRVALTDAKRIFSDCLAQYGADPWVDTAPIGQFEDTDFPSYITEV